MADNGGRGVYMSKRKDARSFTWHVRRNASEGVTGWRIGAGGSNILVAEGSAYGLQYGRRLYEALRDGRDEFPGNCGMRK